MHKNLLLTLDKFTGINTKQGDVGIELEIEGTHLPHEVSGWSVKPENSLRGRNGRVVPNGELAEDTPLEYISPRPWLFRNLLPKLESLHSALTRTPAQVSLTERASTHIHLNMGGETLHTLIAFVIAFIIAEPVIVRLCGDKRNGNLFCIPEFESGTLTPWLARVVQVVHRPGRHRWPTRGKYATLNVDPLTTFGSVEVRCFPNSINPAEINRWAAWLINLREMARGTTGSCESLINNAYNNPNQFLTSVFGAVTTNVLTPQELIQYGVENAFELWRTAAPLWDAKEIEDVQSISDEEDLDLNFDAETAGRESLTQMINDAATLATARRILRRNV